MPLQLLDSQTTRTITDTDLMGEEGLESVVYTVRDLDPFTAREIEKKNTTETRNPRTHQKIREPNVEGMLMDCLDHCLVSWTGVVLADGTEAPCDRTHRWCLDQPRKEALLKACGANREIKAPEVRDAESFRPDASLL